MSRVTVFIRDVMLPWHRLSPRLRGGPILRASASQNYAQN
jgi:hypothetical protein